MSLSDIISNLKTFTWSFTVNYNPTSFSAVALTEDEARESIRSLLTQNSEICQRYREIETQYGMIQDKIIKSILTTNYNDNPESLKLKEQRAPFEDEMKKMSGSVKMNILMGPFTHDFMYFTLDFKTTSDETLQQIIEKPPTKVLPFHTITIFSALDG